MMRLKLQLFGKSNEEIAKEVIRGNYGNGEVRKTNLKKAGYDPAVIQPIVNEMLGVGSKKTDTGTPKATPKATPKIAGVDDSLVDTMNSTFQGSDGLVQQKQEVDDVYNTFKDVASNTNIIDAETLAAVNNPYSKSPVILQAEQLLQSKIDQGYAGTHKDALNNLLNEFMNREDFEYDVDKDQMFQQTLASAMGSGKTAMQDTMEQAAALTGGYGST
jgi:hypothetical protein